MEGNGHADEIYLEFEVVCVGDWVHYPRPALPVQPPRAAGLRPGRVQDPDYSLDKLYVAG